MRIGIIIIVLIITTLLVLAVFSPDAPLRPPGATRKTINKLVAAIQKVQNLKGISITASLENGGEEHNLNERLTAILRSSGFKTQAFSNEKTNGLCLVDGWGRPLFVERNVTLRKFHPDSPLLSRTNEIIIWSAGEDGINNYGQNDDVY